MPATTMHLRILAPRFGSLVGKIHNLFQVGGAENSKRIVPGAPAMAVTPKTMAFVMKPDAAMSPATERQPSDTRARNIDPPPPADGPRGPFPPAGRAEGGGGGGGGPAGGGAPAPPPPPPGGGGGGGGGGAGAAVIG
jgi:hypothetical protein